MASSPPAIIGTEPTWVPYEPTRDCSQGLCSLYCPQWCYFIFPPPPPFDLAGPGPDDSSGHVFSPLVIAIIGVLATAFLLVSYYTFISKYCGTFGSLRRRFFGPSSGGASRGGGGGGSGHGQSRSQESWNVSPASGLDEALIDRNCRSADSGEALGWLRSGVGTNRRAKYVVTGLLFLTRPIS